MRKLTKSKQFREFNQKKLWKTLVKNMVAVFLEQQFVSPKGSHVGIYFSEWQYREVMDI